LIFERLITAYKLGPYIKHSTITNTAVMGADDKQEDIDELQLAALVKLVSQ